jgi:PKD repeat protein
MHASSTIALARAAAVCSATVIACTGPGTSFASAQGIRQAGVSTTPAPASALSASIEITASGGAEVGGYVSASGPNPITKYHIDFGDGMSVDQTGQGFHHVYVATEYWQVTVTVTDSTGATAVASAPFQAVVPSTLTRVAGDTRYDTSTAVSQRMWANVSGDAQGLRPAHAVVLASGENFPDALAGVPLAEYKQGPLLLTEAGRLTDTTNWEIRRVLPTGGTVYILGGAKAVSPAIDATLRQEGYQVVRYGGASRYETALIIAKQGLDDPSHIIVATGQNYPDALAAGPAATGGPETMEGKPAAIVLSDDGTVSDPATAAYIRKKFTPSNLGAEPGVIAVGYQAAIATVRLMGMGFPQEVVKPGSTIVSAWGGYATTGASVIYIAGTDRYVTAAGLIGFDHPTGGLASADPYIGVASGAGFADALTGGAQLASLHGILLLTAPGYIPDITLTNTLGTVPQQAQYKTYTAEVFGGVQAVSQPVEDQLAALMVAKEQ